MRPLTATFLFIVFWGLQGWGFSRWLFPSLRPRDPSQSVLSVWLGLALNSLGLSAAFFISGTLPGLALWAPVSVVLGSISAFLTWRAPTTRSQGPWPVGSWMLMLTGAGTGLVLLGPLLAEKGLGYFSAGNYETSLYAAWADAVKFHASGESLAGRSHLADRREVVAALLLGQGSGWMRTSTLWLVQPWHAAIACLSSATLALLFERWLAPQHWAERLGLAWWLAWFFLGTAQQQYYSLSFHSHYLSTALLFGALLACAQSDALRDDWRLSALVAASIAALAGAYPEMLIPSAAMLITAVVAMRGPGRALPAWPPLLAGLATGAALGGTQAWAVSELFVGSAVQQRGWDLYGPLQHWRNFLNELFGFANARFGLPAPDPRWAWLWAALLIAAAVHAWRMRRESSGHHTVTAWLLGLYAVGILGLWLIVGPLGQKNHYHLVKFIAGFAWIPWLALAAWSLSLARRDRRFAWGLIALLLLCSDPWARQSWRFQRWIWSAGSACLYTPARAAELKSQLRPAERLHITGTMHGFAVIGHFLVYDEDLYGRADYWYPRWPFYHLGQSVLRVGDDLKRIGPKGLSGPYRPVWDADGLELLRPH